MSSRPLCASARTASRTVLRATPSCSTSSGSVGILEPTGHSPEVIWLRSAAMTCSDSAERRGGLRGMAHPRTGGANEDAPGVGNQTSHDSLMGGMGKEENPTLEATTPRGSATRPGGEPLVPDTRAWAVRLVVVGIVLSALNLRPAITSFGALLEEVRDGVGMSGSM